jgi:hypothetical protein
VIICAFVMLAFLAACGVSRWNERQRKIRGQEDHANCDERRLAKRPAHLRIVPPARRHRKR